MPTSACHARTARTLIGWRGDAAGYLRTSDDESAPTWFATVPAGTRVTVCGQWPDRPGWLHLAVEHLSGNLHIPAEPADIGVIYT